MAAHDEGSCTSSLRVHPVAQFITRGDSPHCFSAHLVQKGGHLRCLLVHICTNFGLLQTLIY